MSAAPVTSKFRPRLTQEQQRDLVALIRDGLPYSEIAQAFSVSSSAVTYYAVRAGLARQGSDVRHPVAPTRTPAAPPPARAWRDEAACVTTDPEIFFSTRRDDIAAAVEICSACPVATKCHAYATAAGEPWGIWGGERRTA